MSKTQQQNKDGSWSEARSLPYFPSVWERIGHWFGIHQWTLTKFKTCVMCGVLKGSR